MLKFKLLILKYYSLCNYKTNFFFFFNKLKKIGSEINILYYIINNLYFYKKKKIASILYLIICNKISEINININEKFIFSHKNIYLNNIFLNYTKNDIIYILKLIKNNNNLNLKNLKKIFTNVLVKFKNQVYENLKERFFITFFYSFINISRKKIKKVLKMYIYYNNNDYYHFLKYIKKVCALIHSNQEDFSRKIYLGFLNNDKYNEFPFYLNYLINNLIKKKVFKLEISLDIYNYDLLKILNLKKKIKKMKIFLSINIPDIFFERLIKTQNWYLFDSKVIKDKYNFYIQNFYDEYVGYGNFRNLYHKIINDNKILKIKVDSKNFFLKIIKSKSKIIFSDLINRNNINKHIGSLISNFSHVKIFDKNNYFKKKYFYYKNTNIILQRNNSFYLEIKNKINFYFCKIKKKKFFLIYKLLEIKNEFSIIEKEINFHLNFRTRPFTIKINFKYKVSKEYFYYNIIKSNCFYSKKMDPYCWYSGSELYNFNFFYKNNYLSYNWKKLIFLVKKHFIRNSLCLIFKKTKKNCFVSFDSYLIKNIILNWQKKNEKNKF